MSSESSDDGPSPFAQGYVVPIAGLLAFLFALLAGVSAYPAVSGAPGGLAIPLTFGAASVVFMYVRQRYVRDQESDDAGEIP